MSTYTSKYFQNGEQLDQALMSAMQAVSHAPQTLTEEQQAQARENIGAQPKSVVLRITYGEDEVLRYSHTIEELWAAYQEGCIITCEISIRQGVYSLKTASETEFVFDRFESDSYVTITYDGGSYRITSELVGRVVSVNGKGGDVELTAEDVGALPADADVKNSMVVNVSQDEDGNFVADKTSTEIYEFVQNGGWAVAKVFDGVLSLVSCQPDSCSFAVSFIYGGYADGVVIEVDAQGFVTPNNAALEKLPNPSALTFTGAVEATYDGSNPVTVEIPQGGSGGGIDVSGATVGQTIQVAAVDANGKPTAWSPVDFPSGEKEWKYDKYIEFSEETAGFELTAYDDGTLFDFTEIEITAALKNAATSSAWGDVEVLSDGVADNHARGIGGTNSVVSKSTNSGQWYVYYLHGMVDVAAKSVSATVCPNTATLYFNTPFTLSGNKIHQNPNFVYSNTAKQGEWEVPPTKFTTVKSGMTIGAGSSIRIRGR